MNRLNVKPVSGRLVRHPETGEPVPAEGLAVPRSPYWLRRLKDGDVIPGGCNHASGAFSAAQ